MVALAQRQPSRRVCLVCKLQRECSACSRLSCGHDLGPCSRCSSRATIPVGWDARRIDETLKVPSATLPAMESMPPGRRLVVVPDLDRLLSSPSLDTAWWTMRALMAASSAAGKGGQVLAVTADPSNSVVSAWLARDMRSFARRTWKWAREHGLPPFAKWVQVRSARSPDVSSWPGTVLGPRRRDGEFEVLVQVPFDSLESLRECIAPLQKRGRVRVQVS